MATPAPLRLLLDIGNTHTHVALADARRLKRFTEFPTKLWAAGGARAVLETFPGSRTVEAAAICSVVPRATSLAERGLRHCWGVEAYVLRAASLQGLGMRYPEPETVGADRLADALAARTLYGAPVVAIDFGTATTFDVVDARGRFVGGIIAPGIAVLTEYLHDRTAQLPKVALAPVKSFIGKNTREAIQIAAVRGYQGMVRELVRGLKRQMRRPDLQVVATGGYARWVMDGVEEINAYQAHLTLEGLRLALACHRGER
jgi:type III pantothenate kinase